MDFDPFIHIMKKDIQFNPLHLLIVCRLDGLDRFKEEWIKLLPLINIIHAKFYIYKIIITLFDVILQIATREKLIEKGKITSELSSFNLI